MELQLEQAIKLRDEYKFLEGREAIEGFNITKLIVVPESQYLNQYAARFIPEGWGERNDEEKLASQFMPDSYSVVCLCNYHSQSGDFEHYSFLKAIKNMGNVDFKVDDYK